MVRVFAKRFNGFDPTIWPVCSFNKKGNRDRLLTDYRDGDFMAWIGTQRPPTEVANQGRLLGMSTLLPLAVNTLDHVDPEAVDPDIPPTNWPHAIPMAETWRFVDRPRLTDVLQRQLTYSATVRAVLLDAVDAEAILELAKEPVPIQGDRLVTARIEDINELTRRTGPTRGPTPSSFTGVVNRDVNQPAYTYVLRFGLRNCWKIGCSMRLEARLHEINRHVPVEIPGEQWSVTRREEWPNLNAAFEMEQPLLASLPKTEG